MKMIAKRTITILMIITMMFAFMPVLGNVTNGRVGTPNAYADEAAEGVSVFNVDVDYTMISLIPSYTITEGEVQENIQSGGIKGDAYSEVGGGDASKVDSGLCYLDFMGEAAGWYVHDIGDGSETVSSDKSYYGYLTLELGEYMGEKYKWIKSITNMLQGSPIPLHAYNGVSVHITTYAHNYMIGFEDNPDGILIEHRSDDTVRIYIPLKFSVLYGGPFVLSYTGKVQTGVEAGEYYTITGNTGKNAGTYTATLKLNDPSKYVWHENGKSSDIQVAWEISKALNTLKVKGKTAKIKYSKVSKKAQTLPVSKVLTFNNKGQGKVTYTKASGNKKITINKKTGKVTIKKGLKKGTYPVKVKVKAAGNKNYKELTKTVTFKIKVN